MSNVLTRIQNNQITDSTINAQYKLVPGSITGNLLATNVTFNSNITILGNLTVSNSYTQLNSINTYINDPIVVFNNGYTGSLTGYDMGILINRNLSSLGAYGSVNTAWVWSEDAAEFQAIATTETGTSVSSLNNSGWANIRLGNLTAISGTFSGAITAPSMTIPTINVTNGNITTLYTGNFNTANAVITGGSVNNTVIGNTTPAIGSFTTLNATTGFSTANAVISGGYISALANATVTTAVVTNFSSGNARVTGGYADNFPIGANTAATGAFTTLTTSSTIIGSGNIVAASGTASSSTTTGALVVVGGLGVSGAEWIGGTLDVAGAVTLQTTLGVTGATTLSTATAGGLQAQAIGNVTPGTATFTTETVGGLQAQAIGNVTPGTGNFTTLQGTNFSSGNAVISGGYISALANATITAGTLTTLVATNFSSGNAVISGGYISALANATVTTAVVTNFSSGNAVISGGYADNFPIGANVTATAAFTTLTASGATTLTNSTQSTSASTGALIVTGGVGIAKNLNVGGDAVVSGNLTVQGTVTAIQSTTLDVTDLNITVAKGASSAAAANGAGVTVDGASATLLYTSATDSWNINKQLIGTGASFSNSTASTSTTSGALVVTGGVGIGGALNVAGTLSAGTASFASINNTPIGNATPSTGVFTTLQSTTSTATNFSSGNAVITGGYITGVANVYATTGVTTNFSTANAVISGGSVNGSPIGALSASTGRFTTVTTTGVLTSAGNIVANSGTVSTSTTTGALVITNTGGLGVGGNINAGALTSLHNFQGNVLIGQGSVQDSADSALTINQNTDTPIASNAIVHISGATNKPATIGIDGFGLTVPGLVLRRATGTSSAPTAAVAGDGLGGVVARGYGATGYYPGTLVNTSGLRITADENYTDTAQGTYLTLSTVPRGNVEAVTAIKIEHNGNVMIPSYVYSTSATSGALVVAGGVGIGANLNVGGTSSINGIAKFESNVVISAFTDTTTVDSGSLVLTGASGLNVGGNAYVGSSLYIGVTAFDIPVTHATIVATDSGDQFAQVAMFNTNSLGSADFAAYANNGSDDSGWADMGMTGNEFSDSTYSITKANDGYFIVRPTDDTFGGNLVLATSETGNYNDIVIGVGSFEESSEVARFHGNATTSGYLDLSVGTNATTASNGALRITNNGGLGVTGNVFMANAVTINSSRTTNQDFTVNGVNDDTLIWARPNSTYDQVVIGANVAVGDLVRGAKLIVGSKDSILLPTGTTADRPSNSGGSDVTGMFRYNTTLGYIEFYTGTQWQGVTSQFTVITDEQYTGNGSDTDFTLGASTTTASTIVSINGVMQIPTLAYSIVDGTTLRFTEAPASTDVIDVRRLTTTQSISGIASTNGYMGFLADNFGANITTGTSSPLVTTSFEPNGAQVSYVANVSVASANTATTIDSFDKTKYRSAKYVVQVTNGTDYQVSEVLVIHDGTTATRAMYGTMNTNGNLGLTTTTISGGNVVLQYIAAGSGSIVRIKKDYVAI